MIVRRNLGHSVMDKIEKIADRNDESLATGHMRTHSAKQVK